MTVQEYLEFERTSPEKHDYVDGFIVDVRSMAGNNFNHSLIVMNWGGEIRARLKGKPCFAFDSNLKVRSKRIARYRYPDVSVACEPFEFDPAEKSQTTLMNPKLIVEVLSDSTERTDASFKLLDYVAIDSFREYVLTSQHEPLVITFFREDDGRWIFTPFRGMESSVKLQSLDMEIPLRDLYAGVVFSPETETSK